MNACVFDERSHQFDLQQVVGSKLSSFYINKNNESWTSNEPTAATGGERDNSKEVWDLRCVTKEKGKLWAWA